MRRPRVEVARALITRLYEGRRLEHQSARRAVACIGLRCLSDRRVETIGTVCRFASADSLRMGDGPVAGDRVNRLAPEAGASLQGRNSPERRAASGTRVAAMRVAMVLDVGARLGIIAQMATGMDSKPPATLRGVSACRAMLATKRPPLLSGR